MKDVFDELMSILPEGDPRRSKVQIVRSCIVAAESVAERIKSDNLEFIEADVIALKAKIQQIQMTESYKEFPSGGLTGKK